VDTSWTLLNSELHCAYNTALASLIGVRRNQLFLHCSNSVHIPTLRAETSGLEAVLAVLAGLETLISNDQLILRRVGYVNHVSVVGEYKL
jgi:hypothetical protein